MPAVLALSGAEVATFQPGSSVRDVLTSIAERLSAPVSSLKLVRGTAILSVDDVLDSDDDILTVLRLAPRHRCVAGFKGGAVRVWCGRTGECLRDLTIGNGSASCVALSPDGGRVLVGCFGRNAEIWSVETGELQHALTGKADVGRSAILSAVFSPDGRRALTGSTTGTIDVWSTRSGELRCVLSARGGAVFSLAFSPCGSRVIAAAMDGTARVWPAYVGGESSLTLRGHHGDLVRSAEFSRDGARILTGAQNGTVVMWCAATGATLSKKIGHCGAVLAVAFSQDGSRAFAASIDEDKTVRIWCAATGERLLAFAHDGEISTVGFFQDRDRVFVGCADGTAWIWSMETGERLLKLEGGGAGAMIKSGACQS